MFCFENPATKGINSPSLIWQPRIKGIFVTKDTEADRVAKKVPLRTSSILGFLYSSRSMSTIYGIFLVLLF